MSVVIALVRGEMAEDFVDRFRTRCATSCLDAEKEMTLRVDIAEGAARWPEIVAEVEAGREVVIARGVYDVARVKGTANPRHTAQEVIDAILKIRSNMPPTTIEEILAWRDEGRR